MASAKRKFIIDCDAGVDDARALMMAFTCPDVEVVGITCVSGNTGVTQVGKNVLRTLQLFDKLSIPVYLGCPDPLLGDAKPNVFYYGDDGFGDVPDPNAPDESHLQSKHSVLALLRMSREHKGDVSLVCLGPLTNVAMALRLDPAFGTRLTRCYIMGGNYQGEGNVTPSAEFNYFMDPEAAYVVLNQLKAPITLLPWETCYRNPLPWDVYNKLRDTSNPKSDFLKEIEAVSVANAHIYHPGKGYFVADDVLMACILRSDVITSSVDVYATVEVKGQYTSGQMVVDWLSVLEKPVNMTLITDIDQDIFIGLLYKSIDRTPPQVVRYTHSINSIVHSVKCLNSK